jgi:hypothetical protein
VVRILRVGKMSLMVLLPVFLSNPLVYMIVILLLQFLFVILFWGKFTYRWVLTEHHLMVGSLCGFISSIDLFLSSLLNSPYTFVGEASMALVFFMDLISFYPLAPLLEFKYCAALKNKSRGRSDEDFLVVGLFIRESLCSGYCSLELSPSSKTLATIEAVEIVKADQSANLLLSSLREPTSSQLFGELAGQRETFFERFVTAVYHRYKNTDNICCIEFLVDCILKIKGSNPSQALRVYYDYYERRKLSSSYFQLCRLSAIYEKIQQRIKTHDKS